MDLGGSLRGFRGGLGGSGRGEGPAGGQNGSAGTLMGSFFSSESLVQHQIWFQTLHNGPNDQCFQGMYH